MKIQLDYLGQLSSGKGQLPNELTLPDPTSLREALKLLAAAASAPQRSMLVDEQGVPRRGLVIAVNGSQVSPESDEQLNDGDTLSLLSLVAGG